MENEPNTFQPHNLTLEGYAEQFPGQLGNKTADELRQLMAEDRIAFGDLLWSLKPYPWTQAQEQAAAEARDTVPMAPRPKRRPSRPARTTTSGRWVA